MSPKERLGSPRLRAFVALDLPDDFLEALVRWRESAYRDRQDVRLPHPGTLHVTLVFLGYQAERDLPHIEEAVFAADPPAAHLEALETRGVPPRRSRLHALDLADLDGTLGGWQQELSDRLAAAGLYEPEKRAFWPHVTLARVKRPQPGPGDVPALPTELQAPFGADRVTLYRSTLLPQGARYDSLASRSGGRPD
jgi:RNA 2',3'-cyclic 3'-phosphodiesterase